MMSATWGGMSGRNDLTTPPFPSRGQRLFKDLLESESPAAVFVEGLAAANLLHQRRVAQDVERPFQPLVFLDIDKNSRRPAVLCDHDLLFTFLDPSDQFG